MNEYSCKEKLGFQNIYKTAFVTWSFSHRVK